MVKIRVVQVASCKLVITQYTVGILVVKCGKIQYVVHTNLGMVRLVPKAVNEKKYSLWHVRILD